MRDVDHRLNDIQINLLSRGAAVMAGVGTGTE